MNAAPSEASPAEASPSATPPALIEWMKNKIAAIELANAAERAELAELRRTLAEVIGRLVRIENVVEAMKVRARSGETASTTDADEPAGENADASAVSSEIAEARTGGVDAAAADDKFTTGDTALLENVEPAAEPIVEDTTTVEGDEASIDTATIESAAPAATDAVITASPSLAIDSLLEADEGSASASPVGEVDAQHPDADDERVDTGQPADTSPSTERTISVATSDEPPGPIPPELVDTVRRIQLLEQQSRVGSAEVAALRQVTNRALACLPPGSD